MWLTRPLDEALVVQIRRGERALRLQFRLRVTSVAMMLSLLALSGKTGVAIGFTAAVVAWEVLHYASATRWTRPGLVMTGRHMVEVICITIAGSLIVGATCLPLLLDTSLPLLIAGFYWVFGCQIYANLALSTGRLHARTSFSVMTLIMAVYVIGTLQVDLRPPTLTDSLATVVFAMAITLMIQIFGNVFLKFHTTLRVARDAEVFQRAALEFTLLHDGLTGLFNRSAFEKRLIEVAAAPPPDGFAVFLIDLDGFKPVNDSYGHPAGDAVLKTVGSRLAALFGPDAMVARLGGDEFGILDPRPADPGTLNDVAESILAAIVAPVAWNDVQLSVGGSVGVAVSTETGGGAMALLGAADRAMYAAKQVGGPSFQLYSPNMEENAPGEDQRAALEEALRLGQFMPAYQPRVELSTGRVTGFEALARWHRPGAGIVPPAGFLPVLSALRLDADFTFLFLRRVAADLAGWKAAGIDPGRISVNLADTVLATRSGVEDLEWLLAEHPGLAGHLTLEVTETVLTGRAAPVLRTHLARISALGVRIALDDFGTGTASFQHLRDFVFHQLKIDGTFIRDLAHTPNAVAIVRSFHALACGLGAEVVAEGVETEAQADILRRLGCHSAHGFHFCAPVDAAEVPALVRSLPAAGLRVRQAGAPHLWQA